MLPIWNTGDLLVPVKKVEALGYLEVAMRIQQYITAILRHAVQQKLIRHNPAYDMEGAVQKPQTEHRPALGLEEIPQLLKKIAEYQGRRLTILAIQLNLGQVGSMTERPQMSLNDAKICCFKPSVKPSTLSDLHDSSYPRQVMTSIVMVNIFAYYFFTPDN